jgi:GLPGLI family protein
MGSGKVYRNYDDSLFLRHENVFGKKFIVKKEFRTPTWKLEPEQKEIDGILCKLATTQAFDTIVKAWYCTQYPIPNGPREFWGLPGLILQIQLPLLSMTAIRIEVLNEKIEIKKPKRGKVITEQEYRRIFNEKLGDFLAGDMRTRQKRE